MNYFYIALAVGLVVAALAYAYLSGVNDGLEHKKTNQTNQQQNTK